MSVDEIKTVCYIGAGTMGCYNSLAAALCGYQVVLYDVDEANLGQVKQQHEAFAALFVGGAYCNEEDVPAALARVSLSSDLAAATAEADLVSESVFERLDLKRDIHRQLDEACAPRSIITTNSSALLVSDIEDVCSTGQRFAALHSHLGSPLVDIVPGPRTDDAVVDVLRRYVLSIKGIPLVLNKEYPGYVLNAMLGPVLTTAQALVLTGTASIEAVDRAWMSARNASMGPFGMIDLFGLNLILDNWEHKDEEALYYPALREQALAFLGPYVHNGKVGVKSGQGFYHYPQPTYQQPDFLDCDEDIGALQRALEVALVANAILIAEAGVTEPDTIDRAWMVGTYLDCGPFNILAREGYDTFLAALDQEVACERFNPDRAALVHNYLRTRGDSGVA